MSLKDKLKVDVRHKSESYCKNVFLEEDVKEAIINLNNSFIIGKGYSGGQIQAKIKEIIGDFKNV